MFHPGGTGYFVPTAMPQPAPRAYIALPSAAAAAQVRSSPRWPQTAAMPRPQTALHGALIQGYPQPSVPARPRPTSGASQNANIRAQATAQLGRPITGAQVMQQARFAGVGQPVQRQGLTQTSSALIAQQQRAGVQPGPASQQGFKYTPNTRNMPQQAPQYQQTMNQSQIPPQQSIVIHGQEPLTTTMLAAALPQEQKQMLGERLFPLISQMYPDLAGKITGMLLEMDNSELLMMLENAELLKAKVG
ncbi:unnamed protein product [Soboliphyme baturini]|uniref:PABC domain-containing protein n=1 Tax=Soboliphyme baturini TaxID=241478 RepID=A0A183J675_9BILA|nr:unnamed protein product [Soboliphyme baturini]